VPATEIEEPDLQGRLRAEELSVVRSEQSSEVPNAPFPAACLDDALDGVCVEEFASARLQIRLAQMTGRDAAGDVGKRPGERGHGDSIPDLAVGGVEVAGPMDSDAAPASTAQVRQRDLDLGQAEIRDPEQRQRVAVAEPSPPAGGQHGSRPVPLHGESGVTDRVHAEMQLVQATLREPPPELSPGHSDGQELPRGDYAVLSAGQFSEQQVGPQPRRGGSALSCCFDPPRPSHELRIGTRDARMGAGVCRDYAGNLAEPERLTEDARRASVAVRRGSCHPVLRMRVKFCGITRLDDAEHAARLGAWAIGLNHWEGSPRRCDDAVAAEIGARLQRSLELVGVFVNAPIDDIARHVENERLSMVQLHGDEGLSFCREVARRTGCKVIKAIRVRSTADLDLARSYRTDFHLLDAHRPGKPGGTGDVFDWELIASRRSRVPLILAGGLVPDNVGDAIRVARPFAVDVASGVEAAPGIKDHESMSRFAEAADEAGGPHRGRPVSEPEHFTASRERDAERREREREEAEL